MRKWIGLTVVLGLVALTGCATLTQTREENAYAYERVIDADLKQLGHDWQTFWLAEHPTGLTEWHTR
jgi:hypothetical protein